VTLAQRVKEYAGLNVLVVVEVDPSSHSFDSRSPFRRISHNDSATLGIVGIDTHLHNVVFRRDAELLVDFVLDL